MKKTLLITAIAALSLGLTAIAPVSAEPVGAPPQISEDDAQTARGHVQTPRRSSNYDRISEKARQYEANPDLAPTDADYAKERYAWNPKIHQFRVLRHAGSYRHFFLTDQMAP